MPYLSVSSALVPLKGICNTYKGLVIDIELSDDGKRIRCNICFAASGNNNNKWINKGSLSIHIASEIHASSVESQQIQESSHRAIEQSAQEESNMEKAMDYAILSSLSTHAAGTPVHTHAHHSNIEEQEMWDNYISSDTTFNAGIDPTIVTLEERRRLAQEAVNLDIWHTGGEFLREEDPNDCEQLLDNLEQVDILKELLQNASMYSYILFSESIIQFKMIHF